MQKVLTVIMTGLSLIFVVLAAHAARAATVYRDKAESSINVERTADGQLLFNKLSTSFDVVTLFADHGIKNLILKKVQTERTVEGVDGLHTQLEVEARDTKQKPFDTVLWKVKDEAADGSYDGDEFYLTWAYGCCAALTTYRAYQVKTGKFLFSYVEAGAINGGTTSPFSVEVPNSQPRLKRYLGVLTADASRDFKIEDGGGLSKLAEVTYASGDKVLKRVAVYGPVAQGWGVTTEADLVDLMGADSKKNERRGNQLTLFTSDAVSVPTKAFNGFGLRLKFYTNVETEVLLPVRGDDLVTERLTLPAGYRVKVLP